ncbi:MAG: hypothetical protein U0525_05755 [Patescibacteria group bacterium]
MKNKHNIQGQALVIVLMVIALTATIAGTAAFRTISQTRQTTENVDKQKSSNAAKGIIEKALNNESVTNTNDELGGSGGTFKAGVNPITTTGNASTTFVTSTIPKDSQFLFYLKSYIFASNSFGPETATYNFDIFFKDTSATGCPVLEIIYINTANEVGARKIATPCDTNSVSYASGNLGVDDTTAANKTVSYKNSNTDFGKKLSSSLSVSANAYKLIIIRPLFADTKLGFKATSGNLPPQGETVTSQAQTGGGSQTTEEVYRAYPQIPDYLFTTSF